MEGNIREWQINYMVCAVEENRVNAGKSKVMVFEKRDEKVVNSESPYRVTVPVDERCETVMEVKGWRDSKRISI